MPQCGRAHPTVAADSLLPCSCDPHRIDIAGCMTAAYGSAASKARLQNPLTPLMQHRNCSAEQLQTAPDPSPGLCDFKPRPSTSLTAEPTSSHLISFEQKMSENGRHEYVLINILGFMQLWAAVLQVANNSTQSGKASIVNCCFAETSHCKITH